MKALLKAEFLKLRTVRSTYVMLLITVVLLFIASFLADGLLAKGPVGQYRLLTNLSNAVSGVSIFAALIGVLLMSHEYRHGTIIYSLTSSNNRLKSLLAKVLAVTAVSVGFTVFAALVSALFFLAGNSLRGATIATQHIYYFSLMWQLLFYVWGYAMFGLLLTVIIRNQIGAIVTLLFVPVTVESIMTLLLKDNAIYLPFSALNQVLSMGERQAASAGANQLSPPQAALLYILYLAIGWVIATYLFVKRDAN